MQQAAPGQPRQIAPWLPAQNPQNFPPASANVSPPTGSTGAAAGQPAAEPKRIRTVPIKPDRRDAGRNARSRGGRAGRPAASDPIAAQISGAPLALSPVGSVPANRQGGAPTVTASLPQGAGASPFPTPDLERRLARAGRERQSRQRSLCRAGDLAAERVRRAGLVPVAAAAVSVRPRQPPAGDPAGRSRREGHLLPRADRSVRRARTRRASSARASRPPAASA